MLKAVQLFRARPASPWTLCILLLALPLLALAAPAAAQDPAQGGADDGGVIFTVFARSTPIGVERVAVSRTAGGGWRIESIGQIGPPIALDIRSFEAEYDAAWQPQRLAIDSVRNGATYRLEASFADGTATNDVQQGEDRLTSTLPVTADAVLLPDFFFGAYEALAARLADSGPGDSLPVYVAPRREVTAAVRDVGRQTIRTARGQVTARIYDTVFEYGERRLEGAVWIDQDGRLLRVNLPAVQLDVARQDLALVSTRLTGTRNPGDSDVRVPARGFSLAASVTTPSAGPPPADGWPVVLLVPGTGLVDRDENLGGVPIYAELAAGLADAGYLVLRYDKRGMGQSGGRPESAGVEEYADDVRTMVRYLERRDDVDRDRIVVAAHGEGSWIALEAARRHRAIDAFALLAAPGVPGAELVLERQRNRLARLQIPDAERDEQIALQTRIIAAVLDEGAWDEIPEDLRERADTRWFRTFLEFDPADVVRRTRQPALILHGEADAEIPVQHADRLLALAEARRRREATVELARLPGIDHRLLVAGTPTVDDYSQLLDRRVAAEVVTALVDWMDRVVPADRR